MTFPQQRNDSPRDAQGAKRTIRHLYFEGVLDDDEATARLLAVDMAARQRRTPPDYTNLDEARDRSTHVRKKRAPRTASKVRHAV